MQAGSVSLSLTSVVLLRADHLDAKPLVQNEIDALAPEPHARTNALNFLIAAVRVVYMLIYSC